MKYDLDLLDFANIRRVLQQYAKTPYGKELAQHFEPAPSLEIAQEMQDSVTSARKLIDIKVDFSPEDVPNCRAALKQASNPGAMLSAQAFANMRQLICVGEYLKSFVETYEGLIPTKNQDFTLPNQLKDKISKAITDAGRLKPDASKKLEDLHRQIKSLKEETIIKAKNYIKKENLTDYLDQQNKIHWHGDHLVFLVKAQHLNEIKGVIKGSQSAGAIQMIEPMILLAENNKLEKLSQEIYAEQQAILRSLSTDVAQEVVSLLQLIDVITWVDIVFSAAHLSALMNASAPKLTHSRVIQLDQVYHPTLLIQFIQGTLAMPVPVSVDLREKEPFMLITGPNTGGKTVVLKTVGLLQVMAQCGLHIPSEGSCELGWFDTIMVDMGDRQSMYHQLSTFAGHVEVMRNILQNAKPGSLFLLDELGTGTDPEEGASIAMAMIDTLIEKGSFGIVNTHLPQLKPYAKNHENIKHAAMLFDPVNLTPNYQLEVGKLGQSLGLIIAEKNGLDRQVIEKAKKYHRVISTKD